MSWTADWFREVWTILVASGPYLLVGFFIAGLLEVLIPKTWIRRHLGGKGWIPVAKAALVGAPIPLCSCSVIPTAAQLRREGASPGATAAFLIATPETGVDSIGISYALLDPLMTIARPVSAIVTAIGAGLAVGRVAEDQPPSDMLPLEASPGADCCSELPQPEPEPPVEESCCHPADVPSAAQRPRSVLARAAAYAYGPLMADLTPWFLVGFALSATLALTVPADFFGEVVPGGLPAMLMMLVAGLPLYVCATASTPIAAALIAKGLDPAAAMVFLLAGPATNVATIGVVHKLLGRPALVAYLLSIALFSLAAGGVVGELYGWLDLPLGSSALQHVHGKGGPIAFASGVVLTALFAWHTLALARRRLAPPAA